MRNRLPERKEPQTLELFISNYPPRASEESVLYAIQYEVRHDRNARPTFLERSLAADGMRVRLPNQNQYDAVRAVSGRLWLNHPIWIARPPDVRLGPLASALSEIFQMNSADGVVDLSSLADKFSELDADPPRADLNDIDFVEFLFLRLGTEARDDRFRVAALVLGGNGIRGEIDAWGPFFHFLPHLRLIDLRGNDVTGPASFPDWPRLEVRGAG